MENIENKPHGMESKEAIRIDQLKLTSEKLKDYILREENLKRSPEYWAALRQRFGMLSNNPQTPVLDQHIFQLRRTQRPQLNNS